MATLQKEKGRRITGGEREELTSELKKRYGQGASIRELAAETGRSYGFIHRVLVESDVTRWEHGDEPWIGDARRIAGIRQRSQRRRVEPMIGEAPGANHGIDQRDGGGVDVDHLAMPVVQAGHVAGGQKSAPGCLEAVEQLQRVVPEARARVVVAGDGDELELARHHASEVFSDCHGSSPRESGPEREPPSTPVRVQR